MRQIQPAIDDVVDDADDLVRAVEIDRPADRIGIAEELPDHRLVDDGDAAGVAAVVVGGQEAAGSQPCAERLEEAVRDVVDATEDQVAALRLRHRAQEFTVAAARERNRHRRAGRPDARQRAQAFEQRLGEGQAALRVGIRRIGQRQVERQDPLRREAGIGRDGAHQAAAEEARGDEQHHRQRDLPDDQRRLPARTTGGRGRSVAAHGVDQIRPPGAPCRQRAEQQSRQQRHEHGETGDAQVEFGSIAIGRKSTAWASSTPMASEASPRPAAPPMRASTALSVSS